MITAIVEDGDGDELSALSMQGHEIRLCLKIMCMGLSKGYCIRWLMYHTECVLRNKCVIVGDVVVENRSREKLLNSYELMKSLHTYLLSVII